MTSSLLFFSIFLAFFFCSLLPAYSVSLCATGNSKQTKNRKMRKLPAVVWPIYGAAGQRHCSTNGSSDHNTSVAFSSASSTSTTTTTGTTNPPQPRPSSRTTVADQPLHNAADESADLAERVTSGRSPHLNAAYQAKWQRTSAKPSSSPTHDGPPQQRRQRRRTTTTTATAFAEDSQTSNADLPMVHPGAELPPLPQRKLTEKRVGKFSFVSDPSERASRDFYGHEVPNNTPKPKLPMWASSLTSPALGKVRLVEDTWISQDARGTIDEDTTNAFVKWLTDTVLPADAVLRKQLKSNVVLDLRKATARGVYAKRAFKKGEVVLTIPLSQATSSSTSATDTAAAVAAAGQETAKTHRLTLNSEVLAAYSASAHKRPGLPDYAEIKKVLSARRSSFDPIPHPLFIDQVHAALLLACEKAEGTSSPLYPYLQLLQRDELFNDDRIKELHLGVLDPPSHMEYTEHCNRFQHYLRELHKTWWAAYENAVNVHPQESRVAEEEEAKCTLKAVTRPTRQVLTPSSCLADALFVNDASNNDNKTQVNSPAEQRTISNAVTDMVEQPSDTSRSISGVAETVSPSATSAQLPPPSLADLEWALRVVLSRQKVLPHLRLRQDAFAHISSENVEGEELNRFERAVMKGKYAFYQHVLRAIDEDRLHVNEVDPSSIATVVPLLDMLNHPPGGVGNVTYSVEKQETVAKQEKKAVGEVGLSSASSADANTPLSSSAVLPDNPPVSYQVVVRAAEDVEADEELTVAYTKCYSVAYTLYRYGFLALGRREDDTAALLAANGMKQGGAQPVVGASEAGEATPAKGWWASLFAE